jgi:geranylgeranyl transferase type-2 subunit alpha
MLYRDRRNFHAWGYRRHVVATLESSALQGQSLVESEFEYTTKMIKKDLSNFSAWHNRSQLTSRLLKERQASDDDRRKFLDQEIVLVREALNVGPEDQSLWFYHQYLVHNIVEQPEGLTIAPSLTPDERTSYVSREIEEIIELLEDYDDIKWIYEALIDCAVSLRKIDSNSQVTTDIADWLEKLKKLDPLRSGRWQDLETGVLAS